MRSILVLYQKRPRGPHGIEWRWRLLDARNHRVIGASTEGYRDRADAVANIGRVLCLGALDLDGSLPVYAWNVPAGRRVVMPVYDRYNETIARRLAYG